MKNEIIQDYVVKDGIRILSSYLSVDNLRVYERILEAYIITADVFSSNLLTKELLDSLLVNMLVAYTKGTIELSRLSPKIRSGMNIGFILSSTKYSEYRWVDTNLAC